MAKHPELQEKLHEEIDTILEEFNGELNYECVSNTNYLNKVISGETCSSSKNPENNRII